MAVSTALETCVALLRTCAPGDLEQHLDETAMLDKEDFSRLDRSPHQHAGERISAVFSAFFIVQDWWAV
jgi:hypothetical protein